MIRGLIIALSVFTITSASGQTGTAFGIKGGMVMGNQTWNSQEREFLFGYQGDLFIESVNDSLSVSFFAALGYHQRGSAIVVNSYYNPQTGQTFPRRKKLINHLTILFSNLALKMDTA